MKKGILFLASWATNLIAIIILMMRIFYPLHRIIAFSIYVAGWIPFILIFFVEKKGDKRGEKKDKKTFIKNYKGSIIIALSSILTLWLIFSLFPITDFTLLQSDVETIQERLDLEQLYAENYIEKLNDAETDFISEINGISLAALSPEKKEKIREKWGDYLSYIRALDNLIQDNKYFYQISYLNQRELNERSFVIAYSSFIASQQSITNVLNAIGDVEFIESLLNEEYPKYEIEKDSQFKLSNMLSNPSNIPQANIGYIYLKTINQNNLFKLKSSAEQNYKKLASHLGKLTVLKLGGAMTFFEKNTFKTWFPIQREAANLIGNTKIPARDSSLISKEQIKEMEKGLEPGDAILQRRNWFLSNAGLPGFWKHTAIYISNLTILDEYFSETIKKTNVTESKKPSEYIKEKFPKLYEELSDNKLRTIEAESEGIVSFTLEKSMSADYAAVLRPIISKEEKLASIVYIFNQFEKPYDFNFDFTTDKEIVCSELYYKAYPQMNHLLRIVSGRLVLSPNHIAEDFNENKLKFVYFIDGIEKEKNAVFRNVSDFVDSWKRNSLDVWKIE